MPPRRSIKKNSLLNKQKIITSRLMQLSFKLDDYIYKHMPMSIEKAKTYLLEINSYRKDSSHDQRTLQVIEKLERCMKGVISEQSDMKNTNSVITNTNSNSPLDEQASINPRSNNLSPVYSISDTDKTYYSECCISDKGLIQKDTSDNEIPIIDLCDDIDLDEAELVKQSHPLLSVDIDIQRVISNLSLSDAIPVSNTLVCNNSQNIPDDYENFDKSTELNDTVTLNNIPITEISIDQYQNKLDEINAIEETSMEIVTKCNVEPCKTLISNISNANINNSTLKESSLVTNVARNEIKQKISKKKKTKVGKQENITKKRNTQTKSMGNKQKTSINKIKNKVSKLNNTCNENHVNNVPKKSTQTDAPKMKQCAVNLSWVQKMTHIRKVSASEYDSNFVITDESFWDNCALPEDWDDQQFVYTF